MFSADVFCAKHDFPPKNGPVPIHAVGYSIMLKHNLQRAAFRLSPSALRFSFRSPAWRGR